MDLFKAIFRFIASKIGLLIVGSLSATTILGTVAIATILFGIIGAAAGGSSNNVSAGGQYSCSPDGEVNDELWDSVFGNKERSNALYGHGDTILSLSEEKGIDPVLFAAITIHETGWGTSDAIANKNNPGGLMNPNGSGLFVFSTLEEGLASMANTLYNRIIVDGLVTIEQLGSVYAPIGAENDPTGLNENWAPNIEGMTADLGGMIMNCTPNEVEMVGDAVFPVPFTKNITSHFQKNRLNPVTQIVTDHNGIDFAANGISGTPAVSFQNGTVTYAGSMGGYGNVVFVEHGNGFETRYAHLQSISVSVGTQVSAGQTVGLIGTTGNSTAPHLHFEVLINGVYTDPLPYLQPFFRS